MKYLVHSMQITPDIFSFSFCSCPFICLDATNIIHWSTHLTLSKILHNGFCLTVTITYYVCIMNALPSDIKSLTVVVWKHKFLMNFQLETRYLERLLLFSFFCSSLKRRKCIAQSWNCKGTASAWKCTVSISLSWLSLVNNESHWLQQNPIKNHGRIKYL